MSELVNRFLKSDKMRVKEARQIPGLAVDMFDTTDKFQKGFTTFEKNGNPTEFTPLSLAYYNTERKEMVIPSNFVPTESGITLSRWTPDNRYYQPGQGGS